MDREPKRLLTRLLEACFIFAFSAYLINTAAHWILEVWPILVVIALLIIITIVVYRIWKHKRDLGQW